MEVKKGNVFQRIRQWLSKHYLNFLVGLLIATFAIVALSNQIFISIYPGQKGVLWQRFVDGTVVEEAYEEGFHVIWPWDIMYIYDVREQIVNLPVDVLSKNGLAINVEVAVRFYPRRDSIAVVHKELGPSYVASVLVPEVESAARTVIARYNPDEFYATDRDEIEAEILAKTVTEFEDMNVLVQDIMIKNIALPKSVADAIEYKLTEEQKFLAYDYILQKEQKEAVRKGIEAKGIKEFGDTSNISILKWRGIEATEKLATSPNAKVIVIGTDDGDLPIILGGNN